MVKMDKTQSHSRAEELRWDLSQEASYQNIGEAMGE